MAKATPCSERTLKTPLPQQSSSSSRDEEGQWISVEDRRRRRVAFEEAAKRMLRYLEDSEDLKVGVTELQEQLGRSEEAGVSIRQVAQQEVKLLSESVRDHVHKACFEGHSDEVWSSSSCGHLYMIDCRAYIKPFG